MATVAVAYVALRGALIPLTYDEAFTYFHYVNAPLLPLFLFDGDVSANNHTLNSLLMALLTRLFGTSEFVLRLPNLAAFVLYAAATLALTRLLAHSLARLALGALLLLNPFVLELFSLARGYGLALAFSLASLSLLGRAIALQQPKSAYQGRLIVMAVAAAGVAVFSHLTFLDFFIPLVITAWVIANHVPRASTIPQSAARRPHLSHTPGLLAVVLTMAYASIAAWRLRAKAQFYFGGRTGIWHDVVHSLTSCVLYLQPYSQRVAVLVHLTVALTLLAGMWIAGRALLGTRPVGVVTQLLCVTLGASAAGSALAVLRHAIAGTPYPTNRTASWLLLCLAVMLGLAVDVALASHRRLRRAGGASIASGILVLLITHFALAANLSYAILQYHGADTGLFLRDMATLRTFHMSRSNLVVSTSWELEPSLRYYKERGFLPQVGTLTIMSNDADIAFVSPKDAAATLGLVEVKRYPRTGNIIAIRADLLPSVQ